MRPITLAALSVSALLALTPAAGAQNYPQSNQNGLGGAAGILNNLVNPQQNNRPDNRYPNDGRYPTDARAGGPYARFTDDQLRTEFRRVQNEQRDIDDEMRRRNLR